MAYGHGPRGIDGDRLCAEGGDGGEPQEEGGKKAEGGRAFQRDKSKEE